MSNNIVPVRVRIPDPSLLLGKRVDRVLKVQLTGKLHNLAVRLAWVAIDENDIELAAIMQFALGGECGSTLTMGDLADRVIALKKKAREMRDKKMLRVLDAAIKNGC